MAQRDRRAIPRVDYAALEAGRSTTALNPSLEKSRPSHALNSPSTIVQMPTVQTSQADSKASVFMELESLKAALANAKAENEQLIRNSELRGLQSELNSIQQQNALLRKRRKDPPPLNVNAPPLSVQDLRDVPGLTARADAQLQKLGLSDSSSESDESADDGDGNHPRREKTKRGKKLRSGKTAKLTSKVHHPQIWPHSELSFLYVSKEVTYDNLTLAEFAAGYASILRLPKLSATERTARIEHFASLMYLATQFPWPLVRSLHAAALFEIECGRLRWGDSFSHLEARLLHGPSNQSRTSTAATSKQAVQFCKAFQSGKCSFTKDHFGLIKNERKWVQHICAKCWLTKQDVQRHRENSAEWPFTVSPPPTSSPVGHSNV